MVERCVVVRVPCAHAFRVWTECVGLWWPPGHRPSGEATSAVQLEPRVHGRMYERTVDGREHELGRVLAIDPPVLLRLAWFLGSGSEQPTEVEIRFDPIPEGTRVRVVHVRGQCPPDRFDAIVEIFSRSWATVGESFTAFCKEDR